MVNYSGAQNHSFGFRTVGEASHRIDIIPIETVENV
jgi:hypothetical protein